MTNEISQTLWHLMTVNEVAIGSDNGLAPILYQAII